MRTVRDYQYVSEEDRGASVAIGNFDGVHLGHQAVIGVARDAARRIGAPLGVLTFEPHPREFFAPDAPPFRLMNAEAQARTGSRSWASMILYEINFNKALSSLSPEEFASQVISRGLGLAHVVVGEDFCFGKGRAGTAADLARFGRDMGFGVTVTPLIETAGVEVSSTRIRDRAVGRPPARCGRDAGPPPPDRGRRDPGRPARAGTGLSDRQHVDRGPPPAEVRRLCGGGGCADRPARGQLPRAWRRLASARCSA